jgi:hypothetical protein
MRQIRISLFIVSLLALCITTAVAIGAGRPVSAPLTEVNGSGVSGSVTLHSMPQGGTMISVHVTGLQAGTEYVSLYYENHTCELEPYSEDDVINRFTARGDRAVFTKKVDDNLDEIHSVSIRLGSDFSLKACADVNP